MKFIWQNNSWPKFTWKSEKLLSPLGQSRLAQGNLLGRVKRLGFDSGNEARLDIMTEEAVKTSAIEGERFDHQIVRSSVARHLGLPMAGSKSQTRPVDGLVEMLLDATQHFEKIVSAERLKGWHAALFPTGYSGLRKIHVGQWRGNDEPMRIVSGPIGHERVHFEAPPGKIVNTEMRNFLHWWSEGKKNLDGLIRAGIGHFYFLVIHPFEDGNGRVARALIETALAQDEKLATRYYSLSSQILEDRAGYYDVLEKCSKQNSMDLTDWLLWFLESYQKAIKRSELIIEKVLIKSEFWQEHMEIKLNDRQRKVMNKMLDAGPGNFQGGLTTRKYVGMTKASRATAFREISEMLSLKLLRPLSGKGRSAHYDLLLPGKLK
jgi:Fic family protein